jgi:hypothetical protein
MRERLKVIIAYLFRGWENEPTKPHPRIKIIPPFILEAISYLIGVAIIFKIISYLWSLI